MISVILIKMGKHSDFHLSFFQIVSAWWDFTVVTKLTKNSKSLYGFGGCCLKTRDVCMDFGPCFKVHNLVSVHPKSIILCQMINLDMNFHVVVSVYRLVKIWNLPQFPVEFQNVLWSVKIPLQSVESHGKIRDPFLFRLYAFMFTDKHLSLRERTGYQESILMQWMGLLKIVSYYKTV